MQLFRKPFRIRHDYINNIKKEKDEIITLIKRESKQAGLLIKDVSETVKNKAKEQKCGFLRI